jgi:RNA polymerase sigma factor (sigma-70 family)
VNGRKDQIALTKNELICRFWAQRNAFFGYIHRFGINQAAIEDIFQEACLKFLTAPGKFCDLPPAGKYLYQIIFTIIAGRRKKERMMVAIDHLPERVCEPDWQWQRDLEIERLRSVMADLPFPDRRLLAVHLISELRLREQSEMVNLPTRTYRYQLNRVISKLRKRMTTIRFERTGSSTPDWRKICDK